MSQITIQIDLRGKANYFSLSQAFTTSIYLLFGQDRSLWRKNIEKLLMDSVDKICLKNCYVRYFDDGVGFL